MARCVCLFILYCLISHEIFGQQRKVEIRDMGYHTEVTNVNVSADSHKFGIISFFISPNFLKGLKFNARVTGIKEIKEDSVKSEYKLIMLPFTQKQIITIKGFAISESIEVEELASGSYREYHLNCLPDSTVEIKNREYIDFFLNKYLDSIRKVYQDSILRTSPSIKNPIIKDWTKDFKLIVGLSNGIVAGEIFGFYGELKFGEKTGFALEGGYCPGFSEMYDVRWSGGVKGYYEYWFLSAHYGTTTIVMNKNSLFQMNDDGSYLLEGRRMAHRKGITMLCGYDRNRKWLHFTIGIGATLTTANNPKFLPAWNVGVGISFTDLFSI